ncbi:LytTR family DNA-binding domain-containing protein [Arundinibacter roseus]|nr:LytTR family DNA-binding domain-containing protein [Arundinibacter roseus]
MQSSISPQSKHLTIYSQKTAYSAEGLFLPYPHGKVCVPLSNILVIQSERNYTRLYFRDGTQFLYAVTQKKLLSKLPTALFDRIHRGYAVNRMHISRICPTCVQLIDGSVWAISRRRRKTLNNEA